MTAPARGIDVSTWQHPGQAPIDWEAVAGSGITFVIIKATQGTTWVNPWFERDYSDAFAAGLLVGAYHYYSAGDDPTAQAKLFTDTLIGKRLDLHAWLDFEVPPVSNWTAAGWVNTFLEAARDARPGCGLYCDLTWWGELSSANVSPPVVWLAAPSATEAPAGATVWQYRTDTVPGVPAEVDLDGLIGTRGINLPTAPVPKPVVRPLSSLRPEPEPEPAEPAEAVSEAGDDPVPAVSEPARPGPSEVAPPET